MPSHKSHQTDHYLTDLARQCNREPVPSTVAFLDNLIRNWLIPTSPPKIFSLELHQSQKWLLGWENPRNSTFMLKILIPASRTLFCPFCWSLHHHSNDMTSVSFLHSVEFMLCSHSFSRTLMLSNASPTSSPGNASDTGYWKCSKASIVCKTHLLEK